MTEFEDEMVAGDSVEIIAKLRDEKCFVLENTSVTAATFVLSLTNAGPALVTKTMASGITLGSPATDGEVIVALAPADTASLAAGDYYVELQLTSGSGAVSTVFQGTLTITKGLA